MPEQSISNGTDTDGNRVLTPVTVQERLPVIDILRGVAILGILLLNMQEYSFPYGFDGIYLEQFSSIGDKIVYWGSQFLFRTKFSGMLSILLGLGMAVQVARAQEKGKPFTGFYARRMFFLLLIGLVHDLMLWSGLILVIFAVMGFFLLFFQERRSKTLVTWVIIFSLLPILITAVRYGIRRASSPPPAQTQAVKKDEAEKRAERLKKAAEIRRKRQREYYDKTIDTFRNGSYWDMVRHRFGVLKNQSLSIIIYWGWLNLGLFLLGVWIWQKRILQEIDRHRNFLRRALWLSLALGVVCTSLPYLTRYALNLKPGMVSVPLILLSRVAGSIGLSLFFMTVVVSITRNDKWKRFFMPVAAVGRLAFSNYVFQALLCSIIFTAYGFKMYGKTGPLVNLLLVFMVWAIQVPLSVWWTKRFRFGPVEWLWRSLTYGKRQPMRLE